MGLLRSVDRRGNYLPWLEGIRGYGFLLVFYGHYFLPYGIAKFGTLKYRLAISLSSLALFAVPSFFVLSGYLIGGILYESRNREGHFRVFYSRRVLRVFPVYYLTLLTIAIFYRFYGFVPDYHFWSHFLYIENLLPDYASAQVGPVSMIHFWSLAVEEQFYLLWPIIVWLFPERKKLVRIAIAIVGFSSLLRCIAPLVTTAAHAFAYFTPTRVDSILLGVILVLTRDSAAYKKFERIAKWIVIGGVVIGIVLANWKGRGWATSFWGQEIIIPLSNIEGAALLVAVLEPNSALQRACSVRWACWLGSLSYSAYVFHLIFVQFFCGVVTEWLYSYMSPNLAVLAAGLLALGTTLLLSVLSKISIEDPAMNLKRRIRYGPERAVKSRSEATEQVFVETGA